MRFRTARRAGVLLALIGAAAALPGTGLSGAPPQSDGSAYTWPGAATLTVDVKPWGGGYVRSDPYAIDCPAACIRPFDSGREVKLTAYMTPGHTFKAWEGACAGQGNPCTIKVTGLVDVTAILEGQYVPPTPPPSGPTAPPVVVNPQLTANTQAGACPQCFTTMLTGTGYHANSSIDLVLGYVTPDVGTFGGDDIETSDGAGSWTQGLAENCEFDDGTYSGPVVWDVAATDEQGASASVQVSGTCP